MKQLLTTGSAIALAGCLVATAPPAWAKDITIQMAAPDWGPTRFMQEYANKTYKSPSGNNVTLAIDFIPWPSFYERVAASMASGEEKYQLVVSDSQWIGTFIEGGQFLKLNDRIAADQELAAILQDVHPALTEAYATYPYKSDNIYGFPQMPDTKVVSFRTDLFCHEGEASAFKEKFDKKLPCTYEDWVEVDWDTWGNIGEFFMRKSGDTLAGETLTEDFYGIAYQAGKGYDFSSGQINAFIWQGGASIWDESDQPNAQAVGVVNSDEAVAAFQKYLDLLQYSPPVWKTGQMDIFQINDLYLQGKIAAIINWNALSSAAVNPEVSKVADKTAYAMPPGTIDANGEMVRWDNIGGQPFVLTTWNSDEVVDEALNVVKWWLSKDTQEAFAFNGGTAAIKSVMNAPGYNDFKPWNRAHVELLPWQKDFWHVPEFFELLTQQQEEFDKAITGQKTAKEALDSIAAFQQDLLTEAGRID
ncbi:ABC transporter substrate-binding protein [Labrenzia sp. PHM005]|uniref:ABC transporter substrate-binding protein n=1 Tax=Labrenzia sp. PHM005 TaxID=2590016 RepID=UPI0011407F80|nr:extracellular solute-binding protein [Labrenzia sp. PHM005]QDG78168.1 extracellular solute-binding protein [Labrenzia sp. PHM005]